MEITSPPSQQLKPQWVKIIRDDAAVAEKEGRLQPDQLAVAYQQNWFKMLTPVEYAGMELSLPDEVRLIEAISWADGSMGWDVTLCTGAGWFGGFLDVELSREVFSHQNVCLAGSGALGGTALITDDGYLINGHWKYASGALHATHFTANCIIHDSNGPILDADGKPTVKAFLFNAAEVEVIEAWNYTGMIATGSHSFSVTNVQVPANRAFIIDPAHAVVNRPLYQYPFHHLAEATLAVNLSGLAIHFMELCEEIFAERIQNKGLNNDNQITLSQRLINAFTQMNTTRKEFYIAIDSSWADFADNNTNNLPSHLQIVSKASRKLARTARQIVDELYPYCGLLAANNSSEINRVWRDLHTASQHSLLTFES